LLHCNCHHPVQVDDASPPIYAARFLNEIAQLDVAGSRL